MFSPSKLTRLGRSWQWLWVILLTVPLVHYGVMNFQRPPQSATQQTLFEGITYQRIAKVTPRPQVIHTVTVNLQTSGLQVFISPGVSKTDLFPFQARTTSDFVRQTGAQLAINASFFFPFMEETPWQYFPHSGDRVNAAGTVIANGYQYAPDRTDWPVLCFGPEQTAEIVASGTCAETTVHGVAGRNLLVRDGQAALDQYDLLNDKPYARVAAGVNRQGDTLWLVVIDGKQPFYSQGATQTELANLFVELGADAAINLDGGGSTTLVMNSTSGPKVLNAPIHTKWPMRERPVANHLGFFAAPH